jgi:hypothetical protein
MKKIQITPCIAAIMSDEDAEKLVARGYYHATPYVEQPDDFRVLCLFTKTNAQLEAHATRGTFEAGRHERASNRQQTANRPPTDRH